MAYCLYATPDIDSFEGVCRCCMSTGRVKNMLRTYFWVTEPEVYANMLMDCFSVNINRTSMHLTVGICEFCILRLRDADSFRKQVLSVEEALAQKSVLSVPSEVQEHTNKIIAKVPLTKVKLENYFNDADEDWAAADEPWVEVKMEHKQNMDIEESFTKLQMDPIESKAESEAITLQCEQNSEETSKKAKRKTIPKFKKNDKYNELFPIKWYRNDFICYICETVIKNFEVLTSHLNVHTFEEIKQVYHNIRKGAKFKFISNEVKCRRCSMRVNTLEDFKAHMFTLHSEKFLKTAKTLKEKIKLLKKEKDKPKDVYPIKWRKICFTCIICNVGLSNMEDIKRHVNVHSPIEIREKFCRIRRARKLLYDAPNLRCRACKVILNNFNDVRTHISKDYHMNYVSRYRKNADTPVSNKIPYTLEKDALDCPICGEHFMYNSNLNQHMNLHFPNYICETCGKAFATETRVRAHSRTHLLGDYPCSECDKVFNTVTKRQHHLSVTHRGGTRFYCSKCPIVMHSLYTRMRHLHEIHGEELRRYQCKLCPRRFITPGQQAGHVRKDHMKERNFKCEICYAAFYLQSALKRHMIKHGGEKIYVCEVCEKSYQRKSTLREHMKIHDTVKKHVCNVCHRRFTQKCTLNGHMKVHEKHGDV